MLTIGIYSFLLAIVFLYPIEIPALPQAEHEDKELSVLDELFRLRAHAQISSLENIEYSKISWKGEIKLIKNLQQKTGIGVTPLIDHLIECERDSQTLKREFTTRSATASGASATLAFMPALMWVIGFAIGVDVTGFLISGFGIVILIAGVGLTLGSRLVIRKLSKVALRKPAPTNRQPFSRNLAAGVGFSAVLSFQTTFLGFVFAILAATLIHNLWQIVPNQSIELKNFVICDQQHFELIAISCLMESGFNWTEALSNLQNEELGRIAKRIQMGFTPDAAFANSSDWKEIGNLISQSIQKGTRIAGDLKLIATEYRQQSLNYRIQHCEKIAGRLIIPVNLLQLPAFILLGLTPLVAPLLLQTFETFHI